MSFNEEQRQKLAKQTEARSDSKIPKTYFDLVEKVGECGNYQFRLMIFFAIVNFVTGIVLLSTAFLFRKRAFECKYNGMLVSENDCLDYVCKLPSTEWQKYFAHEDNSFESLASGPEYYCQNQALVDLLSSFVYFGAFIGYLIISFFADNWGRRRSLLIGWFAVTIGAILVSCSVNIYMAAVGMFLCGFGSDVSVNIGFFYFGEVVGEEKRQKYSVFVQFWFPVGSIIITAFFYFMDDWRIIWIIVLTIPCIINLVLLYFFCYETPQFLLKKGTKEAMKVMNKIGQINNGIDNILTEEDVENVMAEQMTQNYQGKIITPLDLCRFPSLRIITICASIVSFMTYAMYYGPALIIDSIGFNIYVSNYVVQVSQLCALIPSFFLIQSISRKTWGMVLFCICTTCALLLNFVKKPEDQAFSIEAVIQIIIVFIFRGSISFYFCYFQIYFCELYPSRARGIGSGIVSAVGTLASTSSPIYLGYLQRNNINPMTIFVLFGIIGLSNVMLLKQTKGVPLTEEIEEIEMEKEKRRSEISFKASKASRIEAIKQKKKSLITDDKINQSSGYSGRLGQ